MKTRLPVLAGLTSLLHTGSAEEKPLRDLATDPIPAVVQSGSFNIADRKVILKVRAAFAVPSGAFPDQKNFIGQLTFEVNELIEQSLFTAMTKQDGSDTDVGFTLDMIYRKAPYSARRIWSYVNNNFMTALGIEGKEEPKFRTSIRSP